MKKIVLGVGLIALATQAQAFRVSNKSGSKLFVCFVHVHERIKSLVTKKEAPLEPDSYLSDIAVYQDGKRITEFELWGHVDGKRQRINAIELTHYSDEELSARGDKELCFEVQQDLTVKKAAAQPAKKKTDIERKRVHFVQKKDCAAVTQELRLEVNKIYQKLDTIMARIEELESSD